MRTTRGRTAMPLRISGAIAAAMASACALVAQAQEFPNRPIRFIVPAATGGASDALSRIIGQRLAERWSQQIVIDNRVGAGGNIGTELVARAAPDGYTWLL